MDPVMGLRPLMSALSPAGRRARLSILIFHRVLLQPDPLLPGDPDAERFRWQMRVLARHFNPLPLDEAVTRLRSGTLPSRAVCVTFDDGYADNASVALPILRETGVPATFFIATGYLDGGRMFNDTVIETVRRLPDGPQTLGGFVDEPVKLESAADRQALIQQLVRGIKYLPPQERERRAAALAEAAGVELPDDLMMRSRDVKALAAAGMTVGAHTVSHPILASLDAAQAREEIAESRRRLESLLGRAVTLFAYPNGRPDTDYRAEHAVQVQELGFEAAVSTAPGAATMGDDPYQLPRFTPWDRTPFRYALRLTRNLMSPRSARATQAQASVSSAAAAGAQGGNG